MTNYERAYLQGFTDALFNRGLTKSAQSSITGLYMYPGFSQDMQQTVREHPTATAALGGAALAIPAALTAPLWGPPVAAAAATAGPALAAGASGASSIAKRYGPAIINGAKHYGSAIINGAKHYGPAAYNATVNGVKRYGPAALNATKRYGAQALNAATRVGRSGMDKVDMARQEWNKIPWWAKNIAAPAGAGLAYKSLDVLFGFDPLGSLDDDKRTVPTLTLSEDQRFNDRGYQDPQSAEPTWNEQHGTYNGASNTNTVNRSRDAYGNVDFLNYGE